MTIFESNLKHLNDKFPFAYSVVKQISLSDKYRAFLSEDGLTNIEIKLDSDVNDFLYDPQHTGMETASWLQAIASSISEHEHVLLYGLGMGHHLQLLLTYFPSKWFYLYEPDAELFRISLATENMADILCHPNLKALSVGLTAEAKRQLIYPICTHAQGACAFLYIPYYARTNEEEISTLREEFPTFVSEFKVNYSTRNRYKEQWLQNRLNHLATNLSSVPLRVLKDRFMGVPAVIVGSGPSLTEAVEGIKTLHDQCLIIAAGTSIQPLLHHGIKPHIVVMADGGAIVEKVFTDSESRTVPMLYSPTTNYRVTDVMRGGLIHYYDTSDLVSKHYMEISEEDPVLRSSASVTGLAIQAAVYMGCQEVVFAGQDFSFPGEVHYAPGVTHFGEQGQKWVVSKADVLVENVCGTHNRTTASYAVLLRNTVEIISLYPNTRFINTSSVGARINGAEQMPIEEYIRETSRLPAFISFDFNFMAEGYGQERVASINKRVEGMPADLASYHQELIGIRKLITKLAEWSRTNPDKCARALEAIEDKWSSVVNRDSFKALYESILPNELHYFDSHLSLIVNETTLIGKSRMFETYVGKIVNEMLEVTPKLQEMAAEALCRLRS
ncbi:motility associated factor glycosyltransferase family protein [Cohnella thailandensis]|uniref:Motility associated factor glycosyltransferase family protein n=1 Tax=Cohnella thailandensis TaxID=557557 RepID=A0A841SN29_9BACL|nr:6-hydroxymethylpterin diphosphokinase MptE-like protein [Cohnella thailandensis]MBB6632582.1 motility associated factor glycosyltransferase family protein [Cohnella thailandensis]MBP1971876.1 hypothetical protein [Cohnella thailandensis]